LSSNVYPHIDATHPEGWETFRHGIDGKTVMSANGL
jgi:hypothetical protein